MFCVVLQYAQIRFWVAEFVIECLKVPTQETNKGKPSKITLSGSPRGLERLTSMKKKGDGGQGMYSDKDVATYAEPTLESLRQ